MWKIDCFLLLLVLCLNRARPYELHSEFATQTAGVSFPPLFCTSGEGDLEGSSYLRAV